ncbi:heavy metal translocating P-type ATPase metal-binding domain-containing protein [Roseivirga sp. E12]|uniref:heavy metal translocating P-type ATPase n=1 Tax=Roseivirga sp. E12 TaxID=2819237 RepID=UPI001ABBE31F|nr:heavy metal translocating P-type ATPase metal-binding domain-containing protein [Roseivirga sp. E12]MBO3698205.1 heavy metal translocating P-type ATPase metal-binding domain-containing protein [Roseivirga sp. E12]
MVAEEIAQKTVCYHCGDECASDKIVHEEKSFCCNGCKTVFEVLSENDLCDYYSLESTPGVTQKIEKNTLFDFLDNQDVSRQLLEYADQEQERVTLLIPNIHCSSCIWLLEHLSRLEPAIMNSTTNFSQRKLTINYKVGDFSLRKLAELLDRIGYTPVVNLEQADEKGPERTFNKSLLVKLGIAGFCFGNVMLLSFPDYLGISALEQSYQQTFRWLNLLLAIPVVFYSGSEYFVSAFKSLKQRFANIDVPIALGVIVLFLRSVYEVTFDIGPGYFDSLVGLIFFLLIGKWFQNRTYDALSFERDYKSYFPLAIQTKRGEAFSSIAVQEIVKGDEVLIRNGELIPADAILIEDKVYIDYSFVTGESAAVEKAKGQYVFAGGKLSGKQARFIVQKPVSQSYLTSLWNNEAFKKEKEHTRLVDRVSQYFTITIIAISVMAAIFWQVTDPSKTWLVFCSVLIVACPCALALSTPFTTGSILRVLGRNKVYLKNADVVERLQKIDTIVFDKTGTITNASERDLSFEGEGLTLAEKQLVFAAVSSSTHPLSRFVKSYLEGTDSGKYVIESFTEHVGQGIQAVVSGVEVKLGSSRFVDFNDAQTNHSASYVYLKLGGSQRGRFVIRNVYRGGLRGVIQQLKEKFKLAILSGDSDAERQNLAKLFPASTPMHFSQKPDDKLNTIKAMQSAGQSVMMVGDGLNDAGALKQSDVGMAVSEDISNFSPACDAIMHADTFHRLDAIIDLAKRSKHVIYASFFLSLAYNIVGLSIAVAGWLTPLVAAILMPLSSISVVVLTTFFVKILSHKLRL